MPVYTCTSLRHLGLTLGSGRFRASGSLSKEMIRLRGPKNTERGPRQTANALAVGLAARSEAGPQPQSPHLAVHLDQNGIVFDAHAAETSATRVGGHFAFFADFEGQIVDDSEAAGRRTGYAVEAQFDGSANRLQIGLTDTGGE